MLIPNPNPCIYCSARATCGLEPLTGFQLEVKKAPWCYGLNWDTVV